MDIILSSPQLVHVSVQPKDASKFLLTIVYASTKLEIRKTLWQCMESLSQSITLPWVVLGDFNEVTNAGDRFGVSCR